MYHTSQLEVWSQREKTLKMHPCQKKAVQMGCRAGHELWKLWRLHVGLKLSSWIFGLWKLQETWGQTRISRTLDEDRTWNGIDLTYDLGESILVWDGPAFCGFWRVILLVRVGCIGQSTWAGWVQHLHFLWFVLMNNICFLRSQVLF